MSRQDRQGVRTAKDLEQKYTFGSIKDIESKVEVQGKTLSGVETEVRQQAEDIKKVNGKTAVAQSTADHATNSAQVADSKAETAIQKADTAQGTADESLGLARMSRDAIVEIREGIGLIQQDLDALSEDLETNYATKEEVANITGAGGGGGDMMKIIYDSDGDGVVDNASKVNGHTVESDVPSNAVFTDTTYTQANGSKDGLMSASDYSKLNALPTNDALGNTYATKEYVNNAVQNAGGGGDGLSLSAVVELIYPVGSIYMSVNSVNPSTFLGGTWEAWGSGRVPVGVDSTDTNFATVEQTGGESTHTLTTEEIPEHNHTVYARSVYSGTGSYIALCNKDNSSTSYKSASAGGGKAHNNLQPYITCYMWKRTA